MSCASCAGPSPNPNSNPNSITLHQCHVRAAHPHPHPIIFNAASGCLSSSTCISTEPNPCCSKLERELSQLQHEHQLAEENNTALMEDRVNLIAQLTQTKIEVPDGSAGAPGLTWIVGG